MPEKQGKYFNLVSFILSRFAFIATHIDFQLWLIMLFNDPFDFNSKLPSWLQLSTLDFPASQIPPDTEKCTPLIRENALHDLFYFALWWASHSILARRAVKQALGLLDHPIERPLYGTIAALVWGLLIFNWRPISNCERWDMSQTPPWQWALCAFFYILGNALALGVMWGLPDHVFGTQKYKYPQGHFPEQKIIKDKFPYGVVRHPGATGVLYTIWALPSYTMNHLFLGVMWTVFIVIGSLIFEEGGIADKSTKFGRDYIDYRKHVCAFVPLPRSVLTVMGVCPYEGDRAEKKQ